MPQGGNTGLVGGCTPVDNEIILLTSALNKIRKFDPVSGILVCESGCILQTLDEYLKDEYGYRMPLDLGAKGSCHIGGNVATNAGGLRLIRYGSLRSNVLGLEYVTGNGDIERDLKTIRKDNTGYDLKQLLIGSEGTLGIITAVSLQTIPLHQSKTAIFGVESFEQIKKCLSVAKSRLGEVLSGIFLDNFSF